MSRQLIIKPDFMSLTKRDLVELVEAYQLENQQLRHIASELHWMARRYADGTRTVISSTFNEYTRALLRMGVKLNSTSDHIIWARDGMGRSFDKLTDAEATPGTPEARGDGNDQG